MNNEITWYSVSHHSRLTMIQTYRNAQNTAQKESSKEIRYYHALKRTTFGFRYRFVEETVMNIIIDAIVV